MKKNSPRFFDFLITGLFLVGFLFFGFNAQAQTTAYCNSSGFPSDGFTDVIRRVQISNL